MSFVRQALRLNNYSEYFRDSPGTDVSLRLPSKEITNLILTHRAINFAKSGITKGTDEMGQQRA